MRFFRRSSSFLPSFARRLFFPSLISACVSCAWIYILYEVEGALENDMFETPPKNIR
jgi:hypothetical protein